MRNARFLFAINPLANRSWGMMLLLGIIFLVLGIFYFIQPIQAMLALTIIFGAMLVFYGIEQLLQLGRGKRSVWGFVLMVLAILIGLACLSSPLYSARNLEIFIGIWMIFLGVDQLTAAGIAPAGTPGRGWALINAIFSLVFGVMAVVFPFVAMAFVGYVIAFYLTVFGLMAITAALTMRTRKSAE